MPSKPLCVFLDRQSIDCDDLDLSSIDLATDLRSFPSCSSDEVLTQASDAKIIIVNKVVLTRAHFEQLEHLKLVCVIATGTNNVDIPAASDNGIIVCNVKDYAAASVSQHVFMLILSLYSSFQSYQSDIKQGKWQAQDQFCLLTHPMQELKNKTIGLIGYGHIAKAVEKIALAFDMKVLLSESLNPQKPPESGRSSLNDLLTQSDIISLHCPLTEITENLISSREFELMKKSAIIINTGRGGIINEADLIDAIQSGEIAGAGIDCLVKEPPDPSDPMMTTDLTQLIITPHNAWGSVEARQRLVDGTAQTIREYLTGTAIKFQLN